MVRPQPQQVRVIPQPCFVEDEITPPQPQAVSRVSAYHRAYAKARKPRRYEESSQSLEFERPTHSRITKKATRHHAVGRVPQHYAFGGPTQPQASEQLLFGKAVAFGGDSQPLASERSPQPTAFRKVRRAVAQPPFAPPPQFGAAPHFQALRRRSPQPQATKRITRALILSLSVCYHARLQDRARYEEGVSRQFVNPLSLPGGDKQFRDEIRWLVYSLIAFMCYILVLFLF